MRRAATSLNLLEDGITADVARDNVFAILCDAVVLREFFHAVVKQAASELVTERVPHNRIHADQSWRQMANRKKLDEFHVHQRCTGAQSQGVAVATHIGRCAVAAIKSRETTGCQYRRFCRQSNRSTRSEMQGHRAGNSVARSQKIDDAEVARLADAAGSIHHTAQCLRYCR